MLGKQAHDRRNLRHSDDFARRPRHAPNPGACPFAAGAPLVQPWCGCGSPLVLVFDGLVRGDSGFGSPRAGGDRPDQPISATAAQAAGPVKCRSINAIAETAFGRGLRPLYGASNASVATEALVPHAAFGGSGRAALSQACGPLNRNEQAVAS